MKYLLIVMVFFIFCCDDGSQLEPGKEIMILANFSAIKDPNLVVTGAHMSADNLTLSIQYGGGCGEVKYELFTNGLFMESNPVQLRIVLSFADSDPCEALLFEDITFDLKPLADHYKESYQSETGTIILRLEDFEEPIHYDF